MRLNTKDLRNERQWRASTGLTEILYANLLVLFIESYQILYGKHLAERLQNTGIEYCIKSENDLLFYTLFALKSGNTYDLLGIIFGMDASNAKRQFECGLEVLQHTLKEAGHMPVLELLNEVEAEEFLSQFEQIIIDVTEQRIQRHENYEVQKEHYSGKQGAHTLKKLVISDESRRINFLSICYPGSIHDFNILKDIFKPFSACFEKANVRVDLGFLGFEKNYVTKELDIPHKKPKNGELTDEQKKENRQIASKRIYVENSIGGMKRYRLLMERLRIHSFDLYDKAAAVCAGLWNYILAV
ncbi:MAG: transposase [Okeania sp. SIO3B3]|nr:transposase [Okeania sp. SIO3B3]